MIFFYRDVDYERNEPGNVASPTTMLLKFDALRVLSQRATNLLPTLLLPFDAQANPQGVRYFNIRHPSLVMWGESKYLTDPHGFHMLTFILLQTMR